MADSSPTSGSSTLMVVVQMVAVAVIAAGVGWFVGQRPISSLQGEVIAQARGRAADADAHTAALAVKDRQVAIQGAALSLCSAVSELDQSNFGTAQKQVDAAKAALGPTEAPSLAKVKAMTLDVAADPATQRAALLGLATAVGADAHR